MAEGRVNIDGFVIVPPLNPWDEKYRDIIIPRMSYHTFDLTATLAWAKHIQCQPSVSDFSWKVQKWHDLGYRLRDATLTVKEERQNDERKI